MAIVQTRPYAGQQPGTSGLRKRVHVFAQPHYCENYLQALFDCLPPLPSNTLIVGGDGRHLSDEVLPKVLRMAAANGIRRCVVGARGLLSTPAASHLVRKLGARGAIVLTASHNPGGLHGDFGIKLNLGNGGPAPDALVRDIYARTQAISHYQIADACAPALAAAGVFQCAGMEIAVVDPAEDYSALMQRLIDFDAIASLRRKGFRLHYDGLSGVTGPYARRILVKDLGFPPEDLWHCDPLPNFGGQYPDPNPIYAGRFHVSMMQARASDFGAACDSDGDRHMIMGRKFTVLPSDSLAVLAQHMHLAPAYAKGIMGVARSIGTSSAVDRVAQGLGVPCYETPTGWRYFGNLLDGGLISLCGEESSGAGAGHIREKDGLWAVLLWLNIIARTGSCVRQLVTGLWRRWGRIYYERRDYEEADADACERIMTGLRGKLARLAGRPSAIGTVACADEFDYHDPVDGSVSERQGIRLKFEGGARIVMRLSGTGTEGATLRLYAERHDSRLDRDPHEYLEPVFDTMDQIAGVSALTRMNAPTLVT